MKTGKDWKTFFLEALSSHDAALPDAVRRSGNDILGHPDAEKAYRKYVRIDRSGRANEDDEIRFANALLDCAFSLNPSLPRPEYIHNRFDDGEMVVVLSRNLNKKRIEGNRDLAQLARSAAEALYHLVGFSVIVEEEGRPDNADFFICDIARRICERRGETPHPVVRDKDILIGLRIVADYCDYFAQKRTRGPDEAIHSLLESLNEELSPSTRTGIQRERTYDAIGLLVRTTFKGRGPKSGKTTRKVIERLRRHNRKLIDRTFQHTREMALDAQD